MILGWIFTVLVAVSLVAAILLGRGSELAAAVPQGAQAGVALAVSLAGSLCLWTGVGRLLERTGVTGMLSRLLKPLLHRLFPETKSDHVLAGALSGNICANFLGLGNAATPMGIQAAQRLAAGRRVASDSLCRLVVLNTASIQLIPTTVATVRAAAGCAAPFDILPAFRAGIDSALGEGACHVLSIRPEGGVEMEC